MNPPAVTRSPSPGLSWEVEALRAVPSPEEPAAFGEFVGAVEPRLRRALVAAYGSEAGRDAAADALAWAWQHWDRVRAMDNPGGYLWRVGQTSVRRSSRRRVREVVDGREFELELIEDQRGERQVEPALSGALEALSPQQRAAVVLVHGHGYSLSEAGEALGCSVSTIRNHVARALRRLQAALEVDDG
jgi:RNA polymerase sigma factor (sigma-70 family)